VIQGGTIYWTRQPQTVRCPHDQMDVVTNVSEKTSIVSWLTCGGLFLLGFILLIPWFICWVPFCIPALNETVHTCPNCKRVLGVAGIGK